MCGRFAFLCADPCGFHNKIQVWIMLKRYLLDMSVWTSVMRLYLHKIIKPRNFLRMLLGFMRIEIFTTMPRNVSGVLSYQVGYASISSPPPVILR